MGVRIVLPRFAAISVTVAHTTFNREGLGFKSQMADCTDEEEQQTRHSVTVEIAGAAPVVGVIGM